MLGYAIQKGHVPLSVEAIEQAIELNAVAVDFNKQALLWGRRAAHDLVAVEKLARPKVAMPIHREIATSLEEVIEKRIEFLTQYQNASYAEKYEKLVKKAEYAEQNLAPGFDGLALSVARYAFKLMSYKDEYEVARLYTNGVFLRQLNEQFEGDFKLEFNLAPPLFSKRDLNTGYLKKQVYGSWLMHVFRVLAKLKGLRGTVWDIFGKTEERKQERLLIEEYFSLMESVFEKLNRKNHTAAVELASIPEKIRGYGHVKENSIDQAKSQEKQAMAIFNNPELVKTAAE